MYRFLKATRLAFSLGLLASASILTTASAQTQCPTLTDAQKSAIRDSSSLSTPALGETSITATLVIPDDVTCTEVSFTTYQLPPPGDAASKEDYANQTLVDNETDVFGPGIHLITLALPTVGSCEAPPEETPCGVCEGGVTRFSFSYSGTEAFTVKTKKGLTLTPTLNSDGTYTLVGDGLGANPDRFSSQDLVFYVGGQQHATLHVSCSQPIYPGLAFGDFVLTEVISRVGGRVCAPSTSSRTSVNVPMLARGGAPTIQLEDDERKVTLCHATGSSTNPYVTITVDKNAVFKQGHDQHQDRRDIIPPFSYRDRGQTIAYPGLNYDAAGQAILENGCATPPPPPPPPPPTENCGVMPWQADLYFGPIQYPISPSGHIWGTLIRYSYRFAGADGFATGDGRNSVRGPSRSALEEIPLTMSEVETGLGQNYPNPFGLRTEIPFSIEQAAHARLEVFDVTGRRVATLVDEALSAGRYAVHFEAGSLPTGLYLYRLTTGSETHTGRMSILR